MKYLYYKLRLYVLKEKFMFKIAWLMPRWLVYFCTIRLVAYATCGKYGNTNVPELSAMDAIKRWEDKNK